MTHHAHHQGVRTRRGQVRTNVLTGGPGRTEPPPAEPYQAGPSGIYPTVATVTTDGFDRVPEAEVAQRFTSLIDRKREEGHQP